MGMVTVREMSAATVDVAELPLLMQYRVYEVYRRLAAWPEVSGAKALQYGWRGHYRIRTGDYRVIFRVAGSTVWVVRVAHRRDVYEE